MKTPLSTISLAHHVLPPLSVSNVKNHHKSPFKIKLRKLILPETENDESLKENKQAVNGKSIQKTTKDHAHKQKHSKAVLFYEDSPTTVQTENLPVSNSRVKQKSVRTLRSKTSEKEISSRHGVSEYESLTKVCQALEFRIDSPDSCSKICQSSVKNRKQHSSAKNIKVVTPNLINNEGVNFTIRTYSRQNSKPQFSDKNKASQEVVNEDETVNRVRDDASMGNGKTRTAGKQACSSNEGLEKTSSKSSQIARKTKGRGKSVSSYIPTSVASESSLQGNSNEALITDMENLVLDSEKIKLSDGNDARKNSTKGKGYEETKKGPQFLFTPSRINTRKEHDETIVPSSSPDEHVDAYARQTNVQLKKNKKSERKKKVIPSSSSSEDETSSKLERDINSEEEAALPRIMSRKAVSTSKKRNLPLRHRFILN
jgi:hypothetical protein